MTDRRRLNGPSSGVSPAVFASRPASLVEPQRSRKPNELRRIFLRTGVVPSANGSAYFELETPPSGMKSFVPTKSTIKLSCTVLGPRPLQRNAAFSPNLQLTASIKFAPYATRQRRGYVRDNIERDLGSHLENALKGVIIPDRWPKSAIEIAVTVLEGEEDSLWSQEHGVEAGISGVGHMNVLAGSITVATAALTDAGVDCLDLITGGVAAICKQEDGDEVELLDPCPSEHKEIVSACVVAYLPSRDEITEVWTKGQLPAAVEGNDPFEKLLSASIRSARGTHNLLTNVLKESAVAKLGMAAMNDAAASSNTDVEMKT